MGWVLVVWVPSVAVLVSYAFRKTLSNGPLHPYVQPYSKHAATDVTFTGGVNWAGSGAGMRATSPLARLTVRSQEIQLGPSVKVMAAFMPTFVIPTSQVTVTTVAACGIRPERVLIRTPHGDVEFLGAGAGVVAEVIRRKD
jgi:hypothetical protein